MTYQHTTYVSYIVDPSRNDCSEMVFPADSRDLAEALRNAPANAQAFYFYDIGRETDDKGVTHGSGRCNISDRYYIDGEPLNSDDINQLPDDKRFWVIARTATHKIATVTRCRDGRIAILLDATAQYVSTSEMASV